MLDLQAINALKSAGAKSFGAQIWSEVQVLMTLTPSQYDLKIETIEAKAGSYDSFESRQLQIAVPGSNEVLVINLKANESADDTLNYKIVQFEALRDSDDGRITKGDLVLKAVVA